MATYRISYRTPFGIFEYWEDAARRCDMADLDPVLCIEVIREVLG